MVLAIGLVVLAGGFREGHGCVWNDRAKFPPVASAVRMTSRVLSELRRDLGWDAGHGDDG